MADEHSSETAPPLRPTGVPGVPQALDAPELDPRLEPLSMSLMGRLFAVPLVIIGGIVGGAVVVVLLFAGPAAPEPRTIEELLSALEMTSGDRSMGVLLPRDKELWQAAQELSLRLNEKDEEPTLSDEELQNAAVRLSSLIKADLNSGPRSATAPDFSQPRGGSARLQYMMRALARTERPEAVETLLDVLGRGNEFYAMLAIKELAELHELAEAREAVNPIIDVLRSASEDRTKLVASTALSVLARPGDQGVIDALGRARLSSEGEVAWSAALAMARLGDPGGKSTLMDLLDRTFLSSDNVYEVEDEKGAVRRYRMPAQRVDEVMLAAIDAAANLDEPDVWDMIGAIAESDPSPGVRGRAQAAVRGRM